MNHQYSIFHTYEVKRIFFPIPDSRFPIPDSRFPIPCSLLRSPCSLLPKIQKLLTS
ncbi:hypothetical protein [Moorena producens]|uniref:hypothetical protein n=1 Tax=Moorena producens TaxID=1155739 RepID=UPI001314369A|nr:hypothetical protein [Moorena producens]